MQIAAHRHGPGGLEIILICEVESRGGKHTCGDHHDGVVGM